MLIRTVERREAALRLMAAHGYSQRRACGLAMVDPKTVRRDRTRDAIRRWQAKIGHPQTGQVTDIERIMLIGP